MLTGPYVMFFIPVLVTAVVGVLAVVGCRDVVLTQSWALDWRKQSHSPLPKSPILLLLPGLSTIVRVSLLPCNRC